MLSLIDYFKYSGDTAALDQHLANAQAKLDHANAIYADPHIAFYGHDERLGACFEEPDRPETKNAYRMLFVRACREFAWAMRQSGRAELAARYEQIAGQRVSELQRDPAWPTASGCTPPPKRLMPAQRRPPSRSASSSASLPTA